MSDQTPRKVGERVTGPDEINRHPVGTVVEIFENADGSRFSVATHTNPTPSGKPWRAQWGVRDPLADGGMQARRKQGLYDPRDASGALLGKRVRVLCAQCGELVSELVDFEARMLVHRAGQWRISSLTTWDEFWCPTCTEPGTPIDLSRVRAALEDSRTDGKVRTIRM